jgi:RNA 3'-terminal phosphate cyclase (ATP)
MLELDGSAGGGQLLRTALSLSAVTGDPFEMTGVRGDRPDPGLKPQHLAAVEAVADACDATVEGADHGAGRLRFEPESVTPGEYDVDIDTAGSVLLVFDAVLPLAAALDADETLVLRATGGTDVNWAPTVDHYCRVKLPLVRRAGFDARVAVSRRGFYPAGGGEATLRPRGTDGFDRLDVTDPGRLERVAVRAVAAAELADAEVAERGARAARQALRGVAGCPVETDTEYVESDCPGAVLTVRAASANAPTGFGVPGERGTPMEEVAADAVDAFAAFRETRTAADGTGRVPAVDAHTADQLATPLALAGGSVTTTRVTDHLRTNAALVSRFGGDLDLDESGGATTVRCGRPLRD